MFEKKFYLLGLLICAFIALPIVAFDKVIQSDWKLEEPDSTPPSVYDLDTMDERLQKLKDEEAQTQQELQAQIKKIQANRKILIECLNQKGVILFTTSEKGCKPCKLQADYLGDDIELLTKRVDCSTSALTCSFRQVKAYPTWYLGRNLGLKRKGVLEMKHLAQITGCPWD